MGGGGGIPGPGGGGGGGGTPGEGGRGGGGGGGGAVVPTGMDLDDEGAGCIDWSVTGKGSSVFLATAPA